MQRKIHPEDAAFARPIGTLYQERTDYSSDQEGVTKIEYFAIHILQGLLSRYGTECSGLSQLAVELSYDLIHALNTHEDKT